MSKLVIDPAVLRQKGNQILDESQKFGQNVTKIYQTIEQMINNNYLSPEATAIANEISTYKDDLERMTRTIAAYGQFCITSADKMTRNQEDIISGI